MSASLSRILSHSRRALRAVGVAGFGVTACAGAQGLYLNSKYKPLPEASGPRSGVFVHALVERLEHKLPSMVPRRHLYRRNSSPADASAAASGAASPDADSAVAPSGKRKLLFVGDSLITGVGCSPEGHAGPALPRAIAEFVCRHLRQDVEWTALGHTGANVRELTESQVPRVRDEVARARAAGERYDAVVVVLGLNDFKRAYRSSRHTAGSFHTELSELVASIQQARSPPPPDRTPACSGMSLTRVCPPHRLVTAAQVAGKQCTVVLPALPVHRAPVFGGMWPLQQLVPMLAGLWDEQKRAIAERVRRVCFVNNADGTEWWEAPRYWAQDGIHPNDEGYRIWGEHIAHALSTSLRNQASHHSMVAEVVARAA